MKEFFVVTKRGLSGLTRPQILQGTRLEAMQAFEKFVTTAENTARGNHAVRLFIEGTVDSVVWASFRLDAFKEQA